LGLGLFTIDGHLGLISLILLKLDDALRLLQTVDIANNKLL
jgi:hypothetical protein